MIVPLKENVLVEIKQTTIVQNDDGVGQHIEGDVLAVGDEVTYVSPGQHVIWEQYAESPVFERDNKKLILVAEDKIMAREDA